MQIKDQESKPQAWFCDYNPPEQAQSTVGRGHDLRSHLGGISVSVRGYRCIQPQGGRLVLWCEHGNQPGDRCLEHGTGHPKTGRSNSSQRSRQPIHQH